MVFSQRNGKTIVSKVPRERSGEASEKQQAHQLKFQKAILYAKSVIADPDKKQEYEAMADRSEGKSTFNIAVADLLNAPDIESLDLRDTKVTRVILLKFRLPMILKLFQ